MIYWGALTAHYPYEVQKCTISANLKSNQEALTLLSKLQTMDEERKAHEENGMETKQKDFRKRENYLGVLFEYQKSYVINLKQEV
jgi:hypothetical protein